GHNHIVINPPQSLQDCSADPRDPGYVWVVDPNIVYDPSTPPPNDEVHPDPVLHPFMRKRTCKPRNVVLSHSGAFAKYVGPLVLRSGVQNTFSLTNPSAIRTDRIPGPVSLEQMSNIFPFDNSISQMQLSGLEVQEMFDFLARRSSSRSCASQAQIAGARVRLN